MSENPRYGAYLEAPAQMPAIGMMGAELTGSVSELVQPKALTRGGECFLCRPDPRLVFAQSENFVALLGLGPIVEGYSLLASKAHVGSMLDLPDQYVPELLLFSRTVRTLLTRIWTAPTITEHGRIALCVERADGHDSHCFHAHQLLFPTPVDLQNSLSESLFAPIEVASFLEARQEAAHLTEYLYYESPDGKVLVGHAPAELHRQFFRRAVAEAVGHPEWQSWRAHPRMEVVWSARRRIQRAA